MRASESVQEIYDRHRDMLYRLCYSYMGNISDAADAVQNTLVKLIERDEDFADLHHEKYWLMMVASNECRHILRHWWRKTVSYDEMKEYESWEEPYRDDEVLTAVRNLPVKYRIPVYMHYYEGYSTAEISRILHLKESTLRSRLLRGRKQLCLAIETEEITDNQKGG